MLNKTRIDAYAAKKQALQKQVDAILKTGNKLALGKKTSNLFRNRKVNGPRLDVSGFNQVISVDPETMIAEVEGMATYETIVAETLKYGCLPTVVPELKSITIGGALTGVAIESSSFRYGLVHETILEFEALLGEGRIVNCSPDNQHADLFYAFPNTYGSLGYALKVKVKLIPVKKYVKLTHLHFTDPKLYFKTLAELSAKHRMNGPVSYIDGVVFSKNDLHITLGEFVDSAPTVSDYKFMKIYYRSIKQRDTDYLTASDYIWRWDTDWFWCSKNFALQNPVMRFLFGKFLLKSTRYWQMMKIARNNSIIKWLLNTFGKRTEAVIQDVELPVENCEAFHQFFQEEIGIKPVWVCPVQAYQSDVKYDFYYLKPDQLFINFGFWEAVPSQHPDGYFNKKIEVKVAALDGHKSLYSNVYYDESTFWKIYNKDLYLSLKYKYDPKQALKSLYQKVTER